MAKVTIGTDDYDAFADLEFANAWLAGDILRATVWATKNDDAKGRGLVSATRMMLALPWLVARIWAATIVAGGRQLAGRTASSASAAFSMIPRAWVAIRARSGWFAGCSPLSNIAW